MTDTRRSLADLLEDLLPQTQCTKCGYPSCRLYAEAIADGESVPLVIDYEDRFRVRVLLPVHSEGEPETLDCVVGANSVVTRSFPPYTVLAGSPARALRRSRPPARRPF